LSYLKKNIIPINTCINTHSYGGEDMGGDGGGGGGDWGWSVCVCVINAVGRFEIIKERI